MLEKVGRLCNCRDPHSYLAMGNDDPSLLCIGYRYDNGVLLEALAVDICCSALLLLPFS